MDVATLNQVLGLGTLAAQVITAGLLVAYCLCRRYPFFAEVIRPVGEWGFVIGFVASLAGSALTLYYSDVLGFAPCALCWWQRVFLYPQVALFAFVLWKRTSAESERVVTGYSIALSLFGLAVALYHHALQMFPAASLPCPATGPSCAQITLLEMGYITFPLMGATLFAFLIVLMLIVRARARD